MKAIIVALLAVGCSSTPEICAQRIGTYVFQYAERDGNCGAIQEAIEAFEKQPTGPGEGCSGSIVYSADNCIVTSDVTCPTTGNQNLRVNGKATWNESASQGNGTQQITLLKGDEVVCRSTYNVTARRQ